MADSIVVGILRAILTLDSAEFVQGVRKATGEADKFSKDLKGIGQSATNLGSQLTKTVTLPLAAMFGGAAKAAMDFEHAFANVGKTVDGVSDNAGQLTDKGKALAEVFRNMALEIPKTTEELTTIAALGGQMGVPIEQLEHFTRNVAALGVAVDGVSTEEAAMGLAQIGNIAGTGTADIQKMASALVHLGNSSNATEGDILEFTKRIMGAGHTVGMTVPEVMALGTAMANVGINAEAGGTAMSTVINKISKAVSEGGEELEQFARVAQMSADAFAETWRTEPIQAIDAFIQGLGEFQEAGGDLNLLMGDLGTEGIRVADTLKRLAGASTGVADALRIANEGFSDADKHLIEAEKKYGTTTNQLKLLWSAIKDVGIVLGDALIPFLKTAIGVAQELLPVVRALAEGFKSLPEPAQFALLATALAAMVAGPVIYGFGQLALSMSAIAGVFGAKGLVASILGFAGATTAAGTAATGAAAGVGLLATTMGTLFAAGGLFAVAVAAIQAVASTFNKDYVPATKAARDQLDKLKQSQFQYNEALKQQPRPGQRPGGRTGDIELPDDSPVGPVFGPTRQQAGIVEDAGRRIQQAITAVGTASAATAPKVQQVTEAVKQLTVQFHGIDATGAPAAIDNMAASIEGRLVPGVTTLSEMFGHMAERAAELERGNEELAQMGMLIENIGIQSQDVTGHLVESEQATEEWHVSLGKIVDAFADLAQIAGPTLSGIVRGIGGVIASVKTAVTGIGAFRGGLAALGAGNILSGLAGIATGIGGIISAAVAGVQAVRALWRGLQDLFGNDEEARDVNPARDAWFQQFQDQFGGSQFEAITAALAAAGVHGERARQLIEAVYNADTMAEFERATEAVMEALRGATEEGTEGFEDTEDSIESTNEAVIVTTDDIEELGDVTRNVTSMMVEHFTSVHDAVLATRGAVEALIASMNALAGGGIPSGPGGGEAAPEPGSFIGLPEGPRRGFVGKALGSTSSLTTALNSGALNLRTERGMGMESTSSSSMSIGQISVAVNGANKNGKQLAYEIAEHLPDAILRINPNGARDKLRRGLA